MKLLKYLVILMLFSGIGFAEEKAQKIYTASIDADGVQRVKMVGGGYYFDPNYIIVKVNVPVELLVSKVGGFTPHNILMKSPEAGMNFNEDLGKEPKTIKFTPTKTGKFPVYCDKKFLFFKDHRDKGMEGTIEVKE
ncbi:MAG: quinol oxidase [Nitrospirae bacterium GWC2_42_7]|nr:MAG: quinol oxidase [Nitrospirae bacterium GWC2_42_7]